jgi:hypothetical protein
MRAENLYQVHGARGEDPIAALGATLIRAARQWWHGPS